MICSSIIQNFENDDNLVGQIGQDGEIGKRGTLKEHNDNIWPSRGLVFVFIVVFVFVFGRHGKNA